MLCHGFPSLLSHILLNSPLFQLKAFSQNKQEKRIKLNKEQETYMQKWVMSSEGPAKLLSTRLLMELAETWVSPFHTITSKFYFPAVISNSRVFHKGASLGMASHQDQACSALGEIKLPAPCPDLSGWGS